MWTTLRRRCSTVWFEKRLVFRVLCKVAGIYLAIPASSGSSVRVFSAAGNIITKKCTRLGTEAVNNLVFFHGYRGVGWEIGDSNPRTEKSGPEQYSGANFFLCVWRFQCSHVAMDSLAVSRVQTSERGRKSTADAL